MILEENNDLNYFKIALKHVIKEKNYLYMSFISCSRNTLAYTFET